MAERPWLTGAVRVVGIWLAIGVAVWASWIVIAHEPANRIMFMLVAMLALSAVASPVYGVVAYLSLKHAEQPRAAKGALVTAAVLCLLSAGTIGWSYLMLQAIGRGLR